MSIIYIEKGRWLHEAIMAAGHGLTQDADTLAYTSDDDVAVQAIIDAFDPVPFAQAEKIDELKVEALRRANAVYDGDEVFPHVGAIKLLIDIDSTYTRAGALAPRLSTLVQIRNAMQAAITVINGMTDWQLIIAYDVVNTPGWPA